MLDFLYESRTEAIIAEIVCRPRYTKGIYAFAVENVRPFVLGPLPRLTQLIGLDVDADRLTDCLLIQVRHRFGPPVSSQPVPDSGPSIAKASVLANRSSVAGAGEEEGERPVAKNSKTASYDDKPAVGPGDRASAVVVGSIQTLSPSNVSGMRSYRVPLL